MFKHRGQMAQQKTPFLQLHFFLSFSIASQSSPFPEIIHKAFLLETVIFGQHNDAINLARYQNQCSHYLSSICDAEDRAFCLLHKLKIKQHREKAGETDSQEATIGLFPPCRPFCCSSESFLKKHHSFPLHCQMLRSTQEAAPMTERGFY